MMSWMDGQRSVDVVMLDFDGTVVNTMPFLVELAVAVLTKRYGLSPEEARRAYVTTTGLPFCKQLEVIFPGNPLNPCAAAEFETAKDHHIMEFDVFPDAISVTTKIRSSGIKVCVSSGNREDLIARLIRTRGLAVDLVMGYRPGFEKGLDHFRFASVSFGSSLDRMVFVGDSLRDGLAARNAGVKFVAKSGLFSAAQFEETVPGTQVIDSLEDMLPLLGIRKARSGSRPADDRASTR